jgi:hypothetical protein
VPRSRPRHGNIIYDEAVYDAAQVRIDLARSVLRQEGIDAIGEPGDPDPYTAAMDAIAEYRPDEVIVSTFPATSSGWLRRDLIERVQDATSLPVQHVVVDFDADREEATHTLVVANRTAVGDPLFAELKRRADESPHRFTVIVPQEGGEGHHVAEARARLITLLDRLRDEGVPATGSIADPDPFTAVVNALQFYRVDEIVISTLPRMRSRWLRSDLVGRVKRATAAPVEHVVDVTADGGESGAQAA